MALLPFQEYAPVIESVNDQARVMSSDVSPKYYADKSNSRMNTKQQQNSKKTHKSQELAAVVKKKKFSHRS